MSLNKVLLTGCFALALLAMSTSIVLAEYVSESDSNQKANADKQTKTTAALESLRGKTFWYRPNSEHPISKVEFFEPGKNGGAPEGSEVILGEKFLVTTETSFVVVDFSKLGERSYEPIFLKIEFPDGKVGYLKAYSLGIDDPDKYPIMDHLYPGKEMAYDFSEYIYPAPPQEIIASEEKAEAAKKAKHEKEEKAEAAKKAKDAAAWKARGGVKVGMNAAQVLKSNWGKPEKINRTITSNVTHEQWVYGEHNYLYFENGVLTAIQN